jgi:hypothetical protein
MNTTQSDTNVNPIGSIGIEKKNKVNGTIQDLGWSEFTTKTCDGK